jgi:tRNA(Ile)-lysidine synthase
MMPCMPDPSDIANRLVALWPPQNWHDLTVLVAVSGGADSVALLRALHAVRLPGSGRLIAAHYNHALRDQADHDEAFVVALAKSLGIDCQVGRALRSAGEPPPGAGIEESARQHRYAFLLDRARHTGARYIVTAHTADDQAETVLHRILRGTGIAGLSGIRRVRSLAEGIALVRPLLTIRRADLRAYLHKLGQAFREDATNLDRRFTRNRLRHDLLPQLAAQYNGSVTEALLRLSHLAREAQEVIEMRISDLLPRAVRFESERIVIDSAPLTDQPRYLVRELLLAAWRRQGWPEQAMGFNEWESLADDLLAPAGDQARTLPGGILARRESSMLVLRLPQRPQCAGPKCFTASPDD